MSMGIVKINDTIGSAATISFIQELNSFVCKFIGEDEDYEVIQVQENGTEMPRSVVDDVLYVTSKMLLDEGYCDFDAVIDEIVYDVSNDLVN